MKQLLVTVATASIIFGIAGCKTTPKAESNSCTSNASCDSSNSRANETVLEHIGNDAATVGKGIVDVVGDGVHAVEDVFDGDKDKKDK
jgi:hypothetical protein